VFNSQKLKTGATCPRAGGGEAVQGGQGDWGQREDALDALRGKRGVVEALVGGLRSKLGLRLFGLDLLLHAHSSQVLPHLQPCYRKFQTRIPKPESSEPEL
jgi:hypothetical protein